MAIPAAVTGTASSYSVNFARAPRALAPGRVELVRAAHLGLAAEVLGRHARVPAEEIGEVLTARAWSQHGAANPAASRKGSAEFDDDQGGIEYSLGLYAADLLNWFLGAAAHPAIRTFAEYDNLNSRAPGYP